MATVVGDVRGLQQQRYHPYNIPHLVKKIKDFPLKVKSSRNTATYQKIRRGVPSTRPPPPPRTPYTTVGGGGMHLLVRPRVNIKIIWLKWKCWNISSVWVNEVPGRLPTSNNNLVGCYDKNPFRRDCVTKMKRSGPETAKDKCTGYWKIGFEKLVRY